MRHDKVSEANMELVRSTFFKDTPRRVSDLLLDEVSEIVIPWMQGEKEWTEEQLWENLREKIILNLKPYQGSTQGYASAEREGWLCCALMFGKRTADLITTNLFEYAEPYWLDGMHIAFGKAEQTQNGTFYTKEMSEWVEKYMPAWVMFFDVPSRIDVCVDVIIRNAHDVGKPWVLDYDKQKREEFVCDILKRIKGLLGCTSNEFLNWIDKEKPARGSLDLNKLRDQFKKG